MPLTAKILTPPAVNSDQGVIVLSAAAVDEQGRQVAVEAFHFSRDAAAADQIVRRGGEPVMDNDRVAPKRTLSQAVAFVEANDPQTAFLKAVATKLRDTDVTAAYNSLVEQRASELVGVHFLPAGRSWKTVSAPTVDKATIARTIRRWLRSLEHRRAAADSLIGEVADLKDSDVAETNP